jgi:2-oxoisovalerate dehydrogenase E2 component (dihydrolipoyl transacylase)
MGTYIIKTPDIGEGIAEVELVAWHVQPGDSVTMDQILADVMTDKATVEVPSPVAGRVLALGGVIGQTMAVGAELVRLEVSGAGNLKAGLAVSDAKVAVVAPAPVATVPAAANAAVPSVPVRSLPIDQNFTPSNLLPAPVKDLIPQGAAAVREVAHADARREHNQERAIASPAVRRRAWELDVDLQRVRATGMAGRVTQADLDAYVAQHPVPASASPVDSAPPPANLARSIAAVVTQVQRPGVALSADQSIPVIGLRRKIAMKMQDSKRRIPHFTYVEEIDVTELDALRERLNGQWAATRGRLTLLPFLLRAVVLGVREFAQMNARFDDDAGVVTRHGAVHMGIATQTDNGLMVPVLRNAQDHSLWSSATDISRVSLAARSGKATREELGGSTITITSLGPLGGIVTTPVINHPEVAIVGVNRMVERPVVLKGAIVVRKMMNLSSSFDHRVVDGLDAARFVQTLRGYLESPATLFID